MSDHQLFNRVKIGILVMAGVFIVHIFLPGREWWPLMRWPMFSGTSATLPTIASSPYMVIVDSDGNEYRSGPGQVYTAVSATTISRITERVIQNRDMTTQKIYRTHFVDRIRAKYPNLDIREIQLWRNVWRSLDITTLPNFDIVAPDEIRLLARFPAEYYIPGLPAPDYEPKLIFDDMLQFQSFKLLNGTSVSPCDNLYVESWWLPINTPTKDFHITGVLAENGIGRTRHDGLLGDIQTTALQTDVGFTDLRAIPIPCDLAPGTYDLLIALYEPEVVDGVPITYMDSTPYGNMAYLSSVDVVSQNKTP